MQHFDAQATLDALPFAPLVQALRNMFASGCEVPLRHSHVVADTAGHTAGTVLLMPAWVPGRYFGLKAVSIFPGNTGLGLPGLHSVYTLFDATTGVPLAHMDGNEITTRRTAAASALAASFLARPDAQRLLIVGAGRVASVMAQALHAVRPSITQVAVFNRRAEPAQVLVEQLRTLGFDAQVAADLRTATTQADIVSCATLSTSALIHGAWLKPGAHLDLVGSFSPHMREADGECLRRCRVFVDTEEALAKAGDVLQAVAEGHFRPELLQASLAQLCRGERAGRRHADECTLFKSVGTALEDLAAAELVFASR